MSERNSQRTSPASGGPMGRGPMMGQPVEKAKDLRGTFKRLIKYLRPEKYRFIAVFILAIASTLFSIVGPKIMGKATTKLAEGVLAKYAYYIQLYTAIQKKMPVEVISKLKKQPIPCFDFGYIEKILLLLVAFYLISALCSYVMAYIMSSVSQNTVYKMRNDVKDKLDRLPLKYFDQQTHGEILSRVTNDMDNIATTLQQSLTHLITSFVTVAGILIMMLTISPVMTLLALVTLPASMIITAFIAKNSQKFFADQQKCIGELNGHVEEMYSGHKIVKVFGHEEDSIAKFKGINKRLYGVGWKAQFMSGIIFPALNFVNNIGYVVICVVGGLLVAKRKIEIGDIQAFIQYMRQFTQPIIQVANIANVLQSTAASAERVFEIMDEVEQIPDKEDTKVIKFPKGRLTFEHVKFSYKEETPLIEDLNLDIKEGSTIAIVGPTGAGKTTLVNLIMRFYEIQGGRITIDGVDIRDLKRGDLRTMFGMVLQDTWLFNGTIRDNIAYGCDGVTEEEIINAAKAANAHHFIRTLPGGYETVLNEEASNISQGQKQLLTIARAILADPAILILDEATSNIDTRTEVLIQRAMANLMKGRTCFVIAHRLSTIRFADLILVMNKGAIIEQGNHEELLARGGFYAELYNSQFTGGNLNDKIV
ncbi:ABC transporter [Peptococcaceae bacterium SCADC1_2_3]|jgi:ATP-binding cassette subfamily B protein|nr:ABC transporter [Peptococcaceae bacterium SCADC1_2_3]KFI36091.1 ABC transporter [Peptococcaceae bacterium SCADC1_2_3]KFI36236.1 ABC transporter [Peptococcaceae bacterium SCADC1_2_3]